jgi:hypothetical protein
MQYRAKQCDNGPKFNGAAVRVAEAIICVIPEQREQPVNWVPLTAMVRELGGDCGQCQLCPAGRRS